MSYLILACMAALFVAVLAVYMKFSAPPPRKGAHVHFENLLVGHRGCRDIGNIPENTMKAFQYAVDQGAQGIECDVRLTKDNVLVVFHDDEVERLLEGSGSVSETTWDSLKKMSFKMDAEVYVPTAREVVDFARKNKKKLLIEVKDFGFKINMQLVRSIVELFHDGSSYDDMVVISFNPASLYMVRSLDPKIVTMLLSAPELFVKYNPRTLLDQITKPPPVLRAIDWLLNRIANSSLALAFVGASMVGPIHTSISISTHTKFKHMGIGMYTWTVNESSHLDFFQSLKISCGTDLLFPASAVGTSG